MELVFYMENIPHKNCRTHSIFVDFVKKEVKIMRWLYDKILYSRKSRQDNPDETVEEVLAKHEAILQEYCLNEFGGQIPPENCYREVVSGESIDEREEIRKVLAQIESPAITGVVVVEPSRLSRGDLDDCAKIIRLFRFSHTLVHTPVMTYNLENKMERKFFQDELLRGNDYLEYTKEILFRGRVAAVKRGCYINRFAPYGYDKVIKGKDHTLEPNENADVVRMIFDWYANEMLSPHQIALRLTEMGIKSPNGEDAWYKESVRYMLKNRHYIGLVYYNEQKMTPMLENGVIVKRNVYQPESEVIVAKGKHPAIIDQALWDKARARYQAPRKRENLKLNNPLAGVLKCAGCGRPMRYAPYKHADDRFACLSTPSCYKSVKVKEVIDGLVQALEKSELPNLELKVQNGDGNARKIQKRLLAKLEKQMEAYREQEDTQHELLETKQYDQETFSRRNAKLRAKMDECQEAIAKARAQLPDSVDYEERVVALKNAIASLKDPNATPTEQNKIVRAIVDRIEYRGAESGVGKTKRGETPFTLEVFLRL